MAAFAMLRDTLVRLFAMPVFLPLAIAYVVALGIGAVGLARALTHSRPR